MDDIIADIYAGGGFDEDAPSRDIDFYVSALRLEAAHKAAADGSTVTAAAYAVGRPADDLRPTGGADNRPADDDDRSATDLRPADDGPVPDSSADLFAASRQEVLAPTLPRNSCDLLARGLPNKAILAACDVLRAVDELNAAAIAATLAAAKKGRQFRLTIKWDEVDVDDRVKCNANALFETSRRLAELFPIPGAVRPMDPPEFEQVHIEYADLRAVADSLPYLRQIEDYNTAFVAWADEYIELLQRVAEALRRRTDEPSIGEGYAAR